MVIISTFHTFIKRYVKHVTAELDWDKSKGLSQHDQLSADKGKKVAVANWDEESEEEDEDDEDLVDDSDDGSVSDP